MLEAAEEVLGESIAGVESAAVPPSLSAAGAIADVPLLQTVEASAASPPPSMAGTAEEVVGTAKPSSAEPIVATEEEVPVLSQPAMVALERDAPEGTTGASSPEIQEAEESSGGALPRDVKGSEVRALELACTPQATVFEVGDDVEDDQEAAACNTLESRLEWVRCAFNESILPATSVSFLCANDLLLISQAF
jgi:hypothetical protein